MLFSERLKLAEEFEQWADDNLVTKEPLSVIGFMQMKGFIKPAQCENYKKQVYCIECKHHHNHTCTSYVLMIERGGEVMAPVEYCSQGERKEE